MKTRMKQKVIQATPQKVFAQMDDFSKTGMHMGESSMMMMGSKLRLEQLSPNATGVGASYRWHGKIMGLAIDFTETVTEWQPPERKEWQTIGKARIIIMSWYRMWFEIMPVEQGTLVKLSISYLPQKNGFFKILSFLFARLYCNWCLNNMLNDTKKALAPG
ncbi:MAG TPA: SRPBCC family protein [Flavisolibacter sp.]|nr:SRPBCC family protein [Flavisolibacter sp.]